MSAKNKRDYLAYLYKAGFIIIFILAIVALLSFFKALGYKEKPVPIKQWHYADSIQFDILNSEVNELCNKIDSLEVKLQKEISELKPDQISGKKECVKKKNKQ